MALKAGYHGIKKKLFDQLKSYTETIASLVPRTEQNILGVKNLLAPRSDAEIIESSSGVTYTFYPDGTIKANGTATGESYGSIYQRDGRPFYLPVGKYLFSCPFTLTNEIEIVVVAKRDGQNIEYGKCRGNNEVLMDVHTNDAIGIVIHVFKTKTVENVIFKPMIRLASDPDDTYEPYAMTNQELTNYVSIHEIPSSDDLDDYKTNGFYEWKTAPTNAPEAVEYASMYVIGEAAIIFQLVIKADKLYTRRYSISAANWSNWYKYTGTQITPSNLTSASPETRSDAPELTEDEPIVKKTTKKATKKIEEV